MGDMADMILDWDLDEDWSKGSGFFGPDIPPHRYPDPARRRIVLKTCNRCGAERLQWGNVGSSKNPVWRLFGPDFKEHRCPPRRPPTHVPNFYEAYRQEQAATPHYLRWARGLKYNQAKLKALLGTP